jgi:putative Mg2+ transporter-C (MgtC) family protein
METVVNLEIFLGLLLATALGAVVGIEREITIKPAGFRTHMLVSLGSCLFTIISVGFDLDPTRIASGIVAGIGFIGAGAIWAEKDKIRGITTASSLWVTAAIGVTVGIGDYALALLVTGLVFLILSSKFLLKKFGLEK